MNFNDEILRIKNEMFKILIYFKTQISTCET